jgi:hypothetical protein
LRVGGDVLDYDTDFDVGIMRDQYSLAANRGVADAVLDLLKAVQRIRLQPAPLCRVVGLDLTSLEDSSARVSTKLVTRLLALAEERARDPWVGLHAGEHAEPRGPMFYMMLSSPRVMDGLRRAQHFSGLLIDTRRLTRRAISRSRA